jgi:hypothetical protein
LKQKQSLINDLRKKEIPKPDPKVANDEKLNLQKEVENRLKKEFEAKVSEYEAKAKES